MWGKKNGIFTFTKVKSKNRVQRLFCGEVLWRQCTYETVREAPPTSFPRNYTTLRISPSSLHSVDLHP